MLATHSVLLLEISLAFRCMDLNTLCQKNESYMTEVHLSSPSSMEIAFDEATSPMVMIMYAFNTAYSTINKNRDATIDI